MNDAVTCLAKEYLETDGKSKAAKRPCLIVFFREPLKIVFAAPGILPPAALVHPCTSHGRSRHPTSRDTCASLHIGRSRHPASRDTCASLHIGRSRHPASRDTCASLH